ncbi:MAG: murein biosynthesis integral membrane protein MurJ [Gemmatimonas sp.]
MSKDAGDRPNVVAAEKAAAAVVTEMAGAPAVGNAIGAADVIATQAAGKDRSGRAATVVGFGILLSRLTGLVRGKLFSMYFGLGMEADAFNAASKIPNIMRSLLGEGSLSASFVPVYSRLLAKGDERGANAMANAILGLLMVAVSGLTLVGIAGASVLTTILTPAFEGEQRELTIHLTRILFPMTALMVLSGWCLGVQNSHRRFFWSYASAAMWNVAQIALLGWWGSKASSTTQLAVWLAWATLLGSVLQVGAQLPEVLRLVRPFRVTFDRAVAGVSEALTNIVPVVTALGVVQLSSLIDLQIANHLPKGSISSLTNANIIVLLPVSIFGISVAASSLPEFSRDSASTDESKDSNSNQKTVLHAALLERLRGGWQRILFYIVPSTIACIVYGDMIVGLLFGGGKFGPREQQIVHAVLAAFAVGLISFGSVKLLSSAHYALRDYKTPLRASLSSLVVSAIVSIAMAWPLRHSVYGAAGIALGTALGSYVNLAVQIRGLRNKIGALYTATMWHGTRRIVIATILAGVLAVPARYLLRDRSTYVVALPTLALFSIAYLVFAWFMGSAEAARWLRRPVRKHGAGS